MKDRNEQLLDTIYELEGLVHLAIVRGEDAPKRIETLIREKINRLGSFYEKEEADDTSEDSIPGLPPIAVPLNDRMPEGEEKTELPEDFSEEDDEDDVDEYVYEDEEDEEDFEEPEDTEEFEESEESEEPEESEESGEEEESEERRVEEERPASRPRPVFSLNDRFLYIREIFGGDASAFRREMDRLDNYEDYDEAEQYFLEEYSLDPENISVQNFLSVLERYYQS